ncbi:hypothetical protein M3090_03530 [Bacteroides sp. ET71]|uniref:hypothetical protein n=1 Tax=Bacteroides sp. ET71 TaxID=2939421 RepID=UPI0020111259|nr:hypothetical protein [Bacteroides sp. ET71]MCL1615471.1 hypothetical protein [Bacteroides sp. ET71]
MRILLSITLCLLALTAAQAGPTDDVKKEINKIKKSSQYIYAESTAPTEEDARAYAEERLFDEVNKWVSTQKKMKGSANLVVNNRKELWTTLSMPRGTNMYRYFIYVKKKDIIPTDNAVVIANESRPAVEEKLQPVLPEAVNLLAGITDYYAMAEKVKQLKAEGKIEDYGRYASLDDPDECYLIIYNREGKVVAILTPGPERLNVKTNQPDGVANYSGCGAIGIEVE